ncbi:inhibitor of growth protein 1-like [Xenia sp. Carnegie-2017]|uniref:inhibitor of growth protein 1-like n=1 Tax=Xenia sp. Carnegie-2017 TaxID=2897299 RepID=UPI001F04B8D2|nr:inhibitor of growth protein 1-like [Xenia sp. Carnegie-2017]
MSSYGENGLNSSASNYVETYLDYVEALPDDLQRDISQMREIDLIYQDKLREISRLIDVYNERKEGPLRKRALIQIQRCLVKSQELGDEKLQHVSQMIDMVDTKSRQVEIEMELAELRNDQSHSLSMKHDRQEDLDSSHKGGEKVKTTRNRRRLNDKVKQEQESINAEKSSTLDNPKPSKKKKFNRKRKKENSPTPDIPIDPNEPTYCLCNQVSYGEMIGCDNDGCEIEWFHFQCVNLTSKPKGKWYCPKCSQERRRKNDKNEKQDKSDKKNIVTS